MKNLSRSARLLPVSLLTLAAIGGGMALAEPSDEEAFDAEADMALRIAQIEKYNDGPDGLNAVIAHSLTAGFKARKAAGIGPLDGRSVLVKDNIETEEWATTAGSLALQ